MGFHKFRGAKSQFDIINLINPALAMVRYESSRDNTERDQIQREDGFLGELWSEGLPTTQRNIDVQWREAQAKIKAVVPQMHARSFAAFAQRYRTFELDSIDLALACLQKLHQAHVITDLGTIKSLWMHLTGSFDRAVRWNVVNRIVSLYIQAHICSSTTTCTQDSFEMSFADS